MVRRCSYCDEEGHTLKGCRELKAYNKLQASLPTPDVVHIGHPLKLGHAQPYLCATKKVRWPNKLWHDNKFTDSLPICEECLEVYSATTGKQLKSI
jgi:hypothetical protein